MLTKKLMIAVGAAVLIAIASLLALAGRGDAGSPQATLPRGNFSVAEAEEFAEFPVFNVGDSFDGLELTAVLRRQATSGTVPTNFVSFIYGDCVVVADTGCAPPAEVQVWPACVRNLALYDPSIPGTPVPETAVVRSVPGGYFENGQRLEIQTGSSTIVIFADSPQRVNRLMAALRGVNISVAPNGPLPPPVVGAVDGKLTC